MNKAISIVKEYKNPYPKDIFCWDNKTYMKIKRGRFNEFIYLVVEHTKQDLIRLMKDEANSANPK